MGIRDGQTTRNRLSALGVDTSASVRGTSDDIVQSLESLRVQEWVEEAQGRLAGTQTGIVQKTEDTGEGGRGSGSATGESSLSGNDDKVPGIEVLEKPDLRGLKVEG